MLTREIYLLIYVLILILNFLVCLCSHTSAGILLCTFRDIPLLSQQTKPPFASAQCFFPTSCPPPSSPSFYALTFWRFSMEILVWFCLDLPFLMLFFERPLLWSQYCSCYRSTAKHRKHFWHLLLCILWHEETINWFFWVLDLHSSIYLLLHMFYLLGWHSSFLEDHKLDQTMGTETVQNYFITEYRKGMWLLVKRMLS